VRWCERSLQVNVDDRVPLIFGHVCQHSVAQNARVVDDDVERAKGIDRGLNQALRAFERRHAVAVGDRLATERLDLFDNLLRRAGVAAGAINAAAKVVDDDLRTMRCKAERMLAADAAA